MPRANLQTFTGSWADKEYHLGKGWRFAYDKGSHEKSAEIHASADGTQAMLTGESAGRQIWWFDPAAAAEGEHGEGEGEGEEGCSFNASRNPNSSDQLLRKILTAAHQTEPTVSIDEVDGVAGKAAFRALAFYAQLQCDDGHWAGDYGGYAPSSLRTFDGWGRLGPTDALCLADLWQEGPCS